MGRYLDLIYGEIYAITARKTRPHAHCDLKCIRAGHRYIHNFKATAKLQGIPDGSSLVMPTGETIKLNDGDMLISTKEY